MDSKYTRGKNRKKKMAYRDDGLAVIKVISGRLANKARNYAQYLSNLHWF